MQTITLTGADEQTDMGRLVALVELYPAVEIGLLYTATPEGRDRYPSRGWLNSAARALEGRCAIHVCGGTARRQLISGELEDLVGSAARVQVNGRVTRDELLACAARVDVIITQHYDGNAALVGVDVANHALLIDGSGGRGISPSEWLPPDTHKPVGFAGGMGPDNLVAELDRIGLVAKDDAWVDMEGKLRRAVGGHDWFDLDLAHDCAARFDSHPIRRRVVAGRCAGEQLRRTSRP